MYYLQLFRIKYLQLYYKILFMLSIIYSYIELSTYVFFIKNIYTNYNIEIGQNVDLNKI